MKMSEMEHLGRKISRGDFPSSFDIQDGSARWESHYFDVMIAAVAEAHSAEVVTTDTKIPLLGVKTS